MPQNPSNFAMSRIAPGNRTGTGGEDLLSNNFNWNLPLVGLKGRGLDLGLTLSYNSLVWTRSGNYVDFDVDDGSIAPGFRLGFPTVEGPYYNDQAGQNFYLLVTPSGARVELRYTGSAGIYESKDSAHLQLIDYGSSLLVRPTDGTQMNFILVSGTWRCNQVKDRNGNFITISYNASADIATVTDTLGRVLTFNYDGNGNLLTITQAGRAQPLATFVWSTTYVGYNFPGLTSSGPDGTSIAVLTQIGLPDGSRYNFEYNNSYGMVSKIRHHAADTHLRRYTSYVAPASADLIPRLTERRDWAENWNGINGVPSEVVTYFAHDGDGACRMTAPDGTIYKEYYGSSWQSGLTIQSEVWSGGEKKQWTTIAWTQDNTGVGYLTNPRVTETNTYDPSGNRRRATIEYGPYEQWSLPYLVREYAADGVTQIRHNYTDYLLTQPYLDRRIIGLVSTVHMTNTSWFVSKTSYHYDDASQIQSPPATTIQHDAAYTTSFLARGNLSAISRWDITDATSIIDVNKALTSRVGYDTNGSAVWSKDPLQHQSTIGYTDAFSDSINRNTFAYPTTATDADGFSSTAQYNFDFGAVTRTEGPPPASQSQGLIQIMLYDDAGRIERVTTQNNGAYTRWIYDPYSYVSQFDTIQEGAGERYTVTVWDGAGRVRAEGGSNPGTTGGYWGKFTNYDVMGRMNVGTNPAEINGGWAPVGDDAAGWIVSSQTYDWKSRPLVTTNQDGTQKYAIYGGCGCAGGEVVTLTDEVGRQQKVYSDVVGRQWKSELLNWNGTVYSTTTNTLNARDQVTLVRQWAGAENGGGAYQDTTMTFDGYGRLKTKHVPEQNEGTATVYAYNADDTIQSVTDARGASATYSYNNRHLVTAIDYSAPGGITPASNVTFGYDAAGNRTSMTDGLGSLNYAYNQLSRMTSETRTFTGLGNYTIGYDYNLAGQLKSIIDHTNQTINYGFDSSGRLNNITGTNYSITQFINSVGYRAWGAAKQIAYGNGRTASINYNSRLQASHFEIPSAGGFPATMSIDYQYSSDGRISYSRDILDPKLDRSYSFDHAARITLALSGAEARGEPQTQDRPYKETFSYDALSHLAVRTTSNWSKVPGFFSSDSYTNNRRVGWQYDADGNLTNNNARQYTLDAAGRIVFISGGSVNQFFDGDGQRVKTTEPNVVTYYLRSSVLGGQVIEELDGTGIKKQGFVYAGGKVLAEQYQNGAINFVHEDLSGVSVRRTNAQVGNTNDFIELDPMGAEAFMEDPYLEDPQFGGRGEGGPVYPGYGNISDPSRGCTANGLYSPCDFHFWGSGIADLPGFGTNWGSFAALSEWVYSNRVRETTAAYRSRHQKPKLEPQKPRRPLTPKERKKAQERRRRDAKKGKMDEGPSGGTFKPVTLPIPLAMQNAPRASDGGMSAPCDQEIEAIYDAVATAFGGTFNDYLNAEGVREYDWQFHLPTGITIPEMRQTMQGLGFAEYTNVNPKDHTPTLPLDAGGFHWKGNVLGDWFHIEFRPTELWSNEVYAADAHYEADNPSYPLHRTATGKRPCRTTP